VGRQRRRVADLAPNSADLAPARAPTLLGARPTLSGCARSCLPGPARWPGNSPRARYLEVPFQERSQGSRPHHGATLAVSPGPRRGSPGFAPLFRETLRAPRVFPQGAPALRFSNDNERRLSNTARRAPRPRFGAAAADLSSFHKLPGAARAMGHPIATGLSYAPTRNACVSRLRRPARTRRRSYLKSLYFRFGLVAARVSRAYNAVVTARRSSSHPPTNHGLQPNDFWELVRPRGRVLPGSRASTCREDPPRPPSWRRTAKAVVFRSLTIHRPTRPLRFYDDVG